MSAIWYECKVKYRKTDEIGGQKVTTEPYLVDALSFTEAERRINEEMSAYISEEFKIMNIKVANYAEIHPFENCHLQKNISFRKPTNLRPYFEF